MADYCVCGWLIDLKDEIFLYQYQNYLNELSIQFLECSWIHEYFVEVKPKGLHSGFTLTLQETRSIHDSMNILKLGFIAFFNILL